METIEFSTLKSIDDMAHLALAAVRVDAHKARLHIEFLLDRYKHEDTFERRSRAQIKRWKMFKRVTKGY